MTSFVTLSLNPSIDVASEADLVRPTNKTRTYNEVYSPGGGGVNVGRVLTELGGDVEVLCPAGGVTGALLEELLGKAGIKHRIIPIAGTTRISLTVYERKTGQEYRFIPNGPKLAEPEWRGCLEAVREVRCEYFVASGSVPLGAPSDILAQIAEIVAAKGAKFVLDSSGIGLRGTLERIPVYLVKPSHSEIEDLVGRRLDEAFAEDAAADLVKRGRAELVAVTMGASGALLATRNSMLRLWAPKVEARSAVGAGDSFLAAMVLALSEGKTHADALALAVAAGAAAVLRPGSTLARREDVMRLYEEISRQDGRNSSLIARNRQGDMHGDTRFFRPPAIAGSRGAAAARPVSGEGLSGAFRRADADRQAGAMELHAEGRPEAGQVVDLGRIQRAAAHQAPHATSTASPSGAKFDTNWEGVAVDDILADAGIDAPPTPYVLAHSFDGYSTNVPFKDLAGDKGMVATHLRGRADRARSRRPGAAARAAPLFLEVGEMGERAAVHRARRGRLLGAARLPHLRRSVARAALHGRLMMRAPAPPERLVWQEATVESHRRRRRRR